jgi:NitT/TauT family transport system permease protein
MPQTEQPPGMRDDPRTAHQVPPRVLGRRSGLRSGARYVRGAIASVCLLLISLGLWEIVVRVTHQPTYLLPAPSLIARTAVERAQNPLLPATWVTFREIIGGFLLGAAAGFVLAVAIAHSRVAARALNPLIVSSQTIPIIAIAPLFIIWFGFGMTPKILMAALITFFPVVVNGTAGLLSVDPDTLSLLQSLSASRLQIFRKLSLPTALPHFFTGLKQAAAISVIGAVVAEWVGATEGLGPVMLTANNVLETDLVFAAILYLSAIAVALYGAVSLIERIALRWQYLARAGAKR